MKNASIGLETKGNGMKNASIRLENKKARE
jgi:hypothetical protein